MQEVQWRCDGEWVQQDAVLLVLLLPEVSIHVRFVGPKNVAGEATLASVNMRFERFVQRRGLECKAKCRISPCGIGSGCGMQT